MQDRRLDLFASRFGGSYRHALIFSFVLLLWTHPAGAAPLIATLDVARSDEVLDCPDKIELAGSVERILERPLRDPAEQRSDVRIQVEFSKDATDAYQARLKLVGSKSGERMLQDESATCGPLAQAVAVALALFLDRELPELPPEPPPLPKQSAPSKPSSSSPRFLVGVRGGAVLGATGGVALAWGGRVGIVWNGWALLGDFDVALPRTTDFEPGAVRISLLRGALQGCYLFGHRVRGGPCAAVALGRLTGSGRGYDVASKSHLFYAAVGPGLELEVPFSKHFFGGASGVLWFPTQTHSFVVENGGTAWRSAPVQGSLALLFGVHF